MTPSLRTGAGFHARTATLEAVRAHGKFFRCGNETWPVKGLTYGPFAPGESGEFLPTRLQVQSDLYEMRALGANVVRLYHTPPAWLLDDAAQEGMRVFIDVPWQKHRCFLEDYETRDDALARVREAAALAHHPAVFALSIANEIPKDIVRFYGERRICGFLRNLIDAAKQRCPECLLTYTNYPSTEFLHPGPLDFMCFNVYLEDPERLGAYLDRLQHQAGTLPLVLGEHGLDSLRHGVASQAEQLRRQVQQVFARGLAGSFVFSYTDEWYAGGEQMHDWAFGVADAQRRPKPAALALRSAWSPAPALRAESLPSVSVVVCSYNGAATLE
ncbi:MAG: glycosyltransferase, partial [Tepidisphaeraceae bacterium]